MAATGVSPPPTSRPIDEFIEATFATVLRLFLMEERQLVIVEDPEEFVPADFFEVLLGLTKIDPQKAAISAGAFHT
ncbi:hypothetical protein A9Z06_00895 [Rhizobium sp. YK2]|nr:hypothetical protein A9Z06_00895 [Rhizobium sp. YK2]